MNQTDVLSLTDGLGISDAASTNGSNPAMTGPTGLNRNHVVTRSVLVSGGSRGIGAAIAARYAADGHRVATLSRSGVAADSSGLALACDVTDSDSVTAAIKQAVEVNGPIDVLIANAGVTDDKLMLRMGEDSFAQVIDTNLTGAYRLVKAVSGPMLRQRWGRIVFVSSVVAMSGSAGQANYAASKAGLVGFARSLAREFGPRGVTCNVVAPGFIDTDMTAVLSDDRRCEVLTNIPLNRTGTPDDVAATIEFLTSEAGGYVTGAVIPVDGGLGMGH